MTVYLLYSATNRDNLRDKLGHAEYSHFFVLEQFRTMLEKRATVIVVSDPESEVDPIYDAMRQEGRACVFLPFCAPHMMPRNIRCPTVPVFAWEFDTIPDEPWDDDPGNDWRAALASTGGAITHSRYGARAVTSAMGRHFPVEWMPAPVWDNYFSAESIDARSVPVVATELAITGTIVDSSPPVSSVGLAQSRPKRNLRWRLMATIRYAHAWYRDVIRDLLPAVAKSFVSRTGGVVHRFVHRRRKLKQPPRLHSGKTIPLELGGYVFLTVLNPHDGRKNWQDMLTAFCTSLRHCADATFILKFTHVDSSVAMDEARRLLSKMPPFQCRVVALDSFLDASQYRKLVASSTFAVNSSLRRPMPAFDGGNVMRRAHYRSAPHWYE